VIRESKTVVIHESTQTKPTHLAATAAAAAHALRNPRKTTDEIGSKEDHGENTA
jgi:hypothetical protein